MKILNFKTDLQNEESVAKAAANLDRIESINNWQIDTNSAENI